MHLNIFSLSVYVLEPTFHVMEGPCFEQSEPILQRESLHGPVGTNHQPAWTMNFLNTKTKREKGLESAQEEWCEPWWTHCHPEIKFQSNVDEARTKFWRKNKNNSSVYGDIFKRESLEGWIYTLDRTVWSCVCQPWQPRWDDKARVGSLT